MNSRTVLHLPGSSVCFSSLVMQYLSKGVSLMLFPLHMMMSEMGRKNGQLFTGKCWERLRVWSFPILTKMLSHNINWKKNQKNQQKCLANYLLLSAFCHWVHLLAVVLFCSCKHLDFSDGITQHFELKMKQTRIWKDFVLLHTSLKKTKNKEAKIY